MKPFQTIIDGTIELLDDGTLIITVDNEIDLDDIHRVIVEVRGSIFCKTMYDD